MTSDSARLKLDRPTYATRGLAGDMLLPYSDYIEVDFDGVNVATLGFIDEFLGRLDQYDSIYIANINRDILDLIARVARRRGMADKIRWAEWQCLDD